MNRLRILASLTCCFVVPMSLVQAQESSAKFLSAHKIADGCTKGIQEKLLESGWVRARITKQGVASILRERPGAINVGISNPKLPGGFQFATILLDKGTMFWLNEKTGDVVIEVGGNPALVQEIMDTGYEFEVVEPKERSLAESMAPCAALPNPKPLDISQNPVVKGGLTETELDDLRKKGWRDVTLKNDGTIPFLFRDKSRPTPAGLFISPINQFGIDGISDGRMFVAKGCTNDGTCWRWHAN